MKPPAFLRRATAALTATALVLAVHASASERSVDWDLVPEILARIQAPTFPDRVYPITEYGAVADGTTDNTVAIRRAIQACAAAGGGRVLVSGGVFLTGPVHLESNVELHVAEGATLKFDPDPKKYMPVVLTRFEGTECMNFSPLIYAFEKENIAVTGKGTLDGSASTDNWWSLHRTKPGSTVNPRASYDRLIDMGDRGVPVHERVFGDGWVLRPNFLQPFRCRNVLIEDVTIVNSPMWVIHPVYSRNVTVRGVRVISHGPNNDGCNPDSSEDVLIENCLFDTGDDCIAVKSGKNADGRRVGIPSQNIVIRNCEMRDGHGGVVLGSEVSGGVRNVFAENCRMDSPNLDRALRLKTNSERGGLIENIFMRDVEVGRVAHSVLTLDLVYWRVYEGEFPPLVRNVRMERVTSASSPRALSIVGTPHSRVENVQVIDCVFRGVESADELAHTGDILLRNVRIEPVKR
jgi:polygalacturonase